MLHELPNIRTVLGISDHASILVLLTTKGNPITRHSVTIQFMTASILKLEVSINTPTARHFSEISDMIFLFVKDIVEIKFILISWVHTGLLSYLRYSTSSLNILKIIKNVMSFTWKVFFNLFLSFHYFNLFLNVHSWPIWESLFKKTYYENSV